MAKVISEMFNGGIVTSRHPSLLLPGELQAAQDCVYWDGDPSIRKAPGRTLYGTVVASTMTKGIAYCPFDRAESEYLLAYSGTGLYSLPVGTSGAQTSTQLGIGEIINGTLSGGTGSKVFTASASENQYPFLASVAGSRIRVYDSSANTMDIIVGAVSGTPSGSLYPAVTLLYGSDGTTNVNSVLPDGAATIGFERGVAYVSDANEADSTDEARELLDVCQWGNRYYVFTGVGAPLRLSIENTPVKSTGANGSVLSLRGMGLAPVTVAPTLGILTGTIGSGAATYAMPSVLTNGFYWVLVTEIYKSNAQTGFETKDGLIEDLESMYYGRPDADLAKGTPAYIEITSSTSQGIEVTLPTPVNNGGAGHFSTHWGIYMAGPTSSATDMPLLGEFVRVKEEAILRSDYDSSNAGGLQTVELYDAVVQEAFWSNTCNAGRTGVAMNNSTALTTPGTYNKSSYLYARAKKNTTDNDTGGAENGSASIKFTNLFNTGGTYNAYEITAVRVALVARCSSAGQADQHATGYCQVKIGSTRGYEYTYTLYNDHTPREYVFGGPNDSMGATWPTASSIGTNLSVEIGIVDDGGPRGAWWSGCHVALYYTSSKLNLSGKPYRVVIYRDQIGTTVHEPAAGLPPSCSTGDFFQGSLVVNDLSQECALRFSMPGEPESFPKPYVLRLDQSKRKDRITLIRSLGPILVVGLENGIKRINYLPRETATGLDDGLVHESISNDHGIVGPRAGCVFDMPGEGPILAYASRAGMFLTNGVWTRPLTMDLDWHALVDPIALEHCHLIAYPKRKWLILYYTPLGASGTHVKKTKAMVFHYQADKVKTGGFLPATGPITVSGRAVTAMVRNGDWVLLTGNESDGKIYEEDYGDSTPSGYQVASNADVDADATIIPSIKTRRIFPAGVGRDARVERLYLLFSEDGTTSDAKTGDFVAGSTTISGSGYATTIVGQTLVSAYTNPDTIITAATASELTIDQAAHTSATGGSFTYNTGTVSVRVSGNSIDEDITTMDTDYGSTVNGDMIVYHVDNMNQALEFVVEKVRLPSNSQAEVADGMRLHQFSLMLSDAGTEQNRG